MQYILNKDGSVSELNKKRQKEDEKLKKNIEYKNRLNKATREYRDVIKNSAVKNQGLNFSSAITDLANINDANKKVIETLPLIGSGAKKVNATLKTAGNISTNMGEGALKTGENVLDTVNDLSDAANNFATYNTMKLIYGKKAADKQLKKDKKNQEEFIKRNLTNEFKQSTGFADMKEDWEKDSLVNSENLGGQIAQGIGSMVPSLVAGQALGFNPGSIPLDGMTKGEKALAIGKNMLNTYVSQLPANAILTASSYGGGLEEALNEGATREQARKYGLANAAIEQGTEMMTGGVPGLQGKGGIDQFVDPLINKNTNGYLNALLKAGYGALGEGLEEYTSTMLEPFAKKIYSDEKVDWNEQREKARQAGLVGTLTGAILNTPQNLQNFKNVRTENQIRNAIGDAEYAEGNQQYNPEYKGWEKQRQKNQEQIEQQKVAKEQRINKIKDNLNRIEQQSKQESTNTQEVQNVPENVSNNVINNQNNNVAENTSNQVVERNNVKEQNNTTENKQDNLSNNKEFQEARLKVAEGTASEQERSYIKTAVESQNTEKMVEQMNETAKTYEVLANEKTLKEAENKLSTYKTLEEKAQYVNSILNSDKRLNASDMAAAELVLKDAAAAKNTKLYNETLENIAIYATEQGQSIQALSLIRKMSPTSQLDVLEKIIKKEKMSGNKAYADVEVTEDMRNRIFDCYDENGQVNQEQFDNTMEEIKQELADEIKVGVDEKVRAWRYLSMLGNPKTHVRNVVANTAMSVVKAIKDTISAAGQDVFIRDKANKTRTLERSSQDIKSFAEDTYNQVSKDSFGNKYNEKSDLENRSKVFKTRWLEAVRKFNDTALSVEDQKFKEINFKKSFANYLTAQGINSQADIDANPQIVNKAKLYAMEEANVATFNQRNRLAEFINSGDKKLGVGYRVARGALIPFTRTPLNIAKTGLEYTPGTGTLMMWNDVAKAPKNMKGTVLIDGLSKQMTGTSLMLLGYALAKAGTVTAGEDDDKEGKFKKDMGSSMDFSIKLGDTSYDLSWLSPSSMPFFVGAKMFEVLDKQEGINENIILESIASTLDPLSEMSCISSFTKVLQSYKQEGAGQLKDIAVSTLQNYLSQFIPTVSGQIARLFDDNKRTTSADSNSPNKITQETYRTLAYKIPGLRNTLPESTDYYGRTKKEYNEGHISKGSELLGIDTKGNVIDRLFNSFISPANKREDTMSKEDEEILRLYNKTGNDDIIPAALRQDLKFNDKQYKMSRKEYNKYKKDFGDTFTKNVKKLMNTSDYKNASDDDKATMVAGLMKYSKDKTKDNYLTKQGENYTKYTSKGEESPYESDKVDSLTNDNFSIADYYIYKTYTPNLVNGNIDNIKNKLNVVSTFGIDKNIYSKYLEEIDNITGDVDSNGKTIQNSRKKKVFEYINGLDLTAEQKQLLMKMEYKSYRNADRQLFNTINNSDLTLEEKKNLKSFLKIGE